MSVRATRWSRSHRITTFAIHASGLSAVGKFKLPGIACGNCELQQPASMLHDVRVLCLSPSTVARSKQMHSTALALIPSLRKTS